MYFKSSTWLVIFLFALVVFWSEFVLYYITLLQCTWPTIPKENNDKFILPGANSKPVKILIVSDTHISFRHAFFDRHRRAWQMSRAFQAAMALHQPDIVFHLGDVLDSGALDPQWAFEQDAATAHRIFSLDKETTPFKVIPGNHDIGETNSMHPSSYSRFAETFLNSTSPEGPPPVTLWAKKGLLFVFLNSMAVGGEGCYFCSRAEEALTDVTRKLYCLRGDIAMEACQNNMSHIIEPGSDAINAGTYTRPILLQHYPMFRPDETVCEAGYVDSMPVSLRKNPYTINKDCMDMDTSRQLFYSLQPRLIFGGHSHYYCHRNYSLKSHHETWEVEEYSVPPFSHRVSYHPSFILLHISENGHAVRRCPIPTERAICLSYFIGIALIGLFLITRRGTVSSLFGFLSARRQARAHGAKEN